MKSILIKFFASMMLFAFAFSVNAAASEHVAESKQSSTHQEETYKAQPMGDMIISFLKSTGVVALVHPRADEMSATGQPMSDFSKGVGRIIMILVTFLLFWLAIAKGFEPLLLLPIAFAWWCCTIWYFWNTCWCNGSCSNGLG